MADNRQAPAESPWRRFMPLIVGLVVLMVLLFTPVKQWLNQVPNLWAVLYPLLILFAGYLVVESVRNREGAGVVAKWVVLFCAAASATLHVYGGGRLFYMLSRWGALFFVVAEVIDTFLGVGTSDDDEAT